MKASKNAIDIIKKYEGCRLESYKCPAGVWTIGYGHTGNVNGKSITMGMTITELMAETLLTIDLQRFEYAINKLNLDLKQNQFDALISFVFNIGIGAFEKSTMLKLLNVGNYDGAANQFDCWIYANGKKLAGLIKRRADEKKLSIS